MIFPVKFDYTTALKFCLFVFFPFKRKLCCFLCDPMHLIKCVRLRKGGCRRYVFLASSIRCWMKAKIFSHLILFLAVHINLYYINFNKPWTDYLRIIENNLIIVLFILLYFY